MSIETLSETETQITFDERDANLDEILSVARRKWPDTPIDHIEIKQSLAGSYIYALTLDNNPRKNFRSDGQLTIYPCITLGQLIRATAAKPGEAYRDKVTLCWNDYALHLKRPVQIPA